MHNLKHAQCFEIPHSSSLAYSGQVRIPVPSLTRDKSTFPTPTASAIPNTPHQTW